MLAQKKQYLTPQEYLLLERQSEWKSEYFNGEIFAMSGATEEHILIVVNIATALHNQFRGRPCKVYANDMRVKVNKTGLYTYPDVIAICDKAKLEDEHLDTLLNPTVIFEVLSKSTEGYDRGVKFAHYRSIETLQEYVLVSQDRFLIEHYVRQPNNLWLLSTMDKLTDTMTLPSMQCALALNDVYDKVEFND
jgi:Uma2 family endonuclease